jgi:hypothetical protein
MSKDAFFRLLEQINRYGDGMRNQKIVVPFLSETSLFCSFNTGSGPTQPPIHPEPWPFYLKLKR